MEETVIIWLEDNAQKQIPIDGNNIKEQALRFYKMIKANNRLHPYNPLMRKATYFLQRHALHNKEFPLKKNNNRWFRLGF